MTQIFSSYSKKLLILTLLISVVPIVIFGSIMYVEAIDREIDLIKNQLIGTSKSNSKNISDWINARKINVNDIAQNSIVISTAKKLLSDNIDDYELFEAKFLLEKQLAIAHQNHNWLKDLRISDPFTGDTLFYTGLSTPKYNLNYQNHFLEAIEGKTSSSDIYPSLEIIKNEYGSFERGVPTLLVSSPIKGEVGTMAILTARVDIFEINQFLLRNNNNFVSVDSYLLNSNGVLLSKPNFLSKFWNQNLFETRPELEMSLNPQFWNDNFNKFSNSEIIEFGWNHGYDNFLGEKVVGVSVPVTDTNWHYLTQISHDEAFYSSNLFQLILLSLIGVTLLVVSGISIFYSSKLTEPIKNLINVTDQIKKGNLKVNILSGGKDEIHDLAVSFNSMAKSLKRSKEIEQALLKKYQDLYEHAPVLNRTINMDGIIINCNKAYADSFGYAKDEIIGKSIFEFVPEEHKELLEASFSTWRKSGNVNNREIIFKKKDGRTFPGLLSANNLYNSKGKRIGSNTIIVDVSDIREKEKEIEDLKEKRLSTIGELTARIAHDMRNPLSVIKNTADIIKMEQLDMDETGRQNWERLERGIYRIKHQIEDVLDYVKNTPLKKEPSRFNLILQDAIERVSVPTSISINIPDEDVDVLCDSEKLETVFVNLIMNSIQAIEGNLGRIDITVVNDGEDFIKIKIEDSGPGIPQHLLSKIFDPLFTTRQIGTGLGLPSCKNIIKNHGGSIAVFSPLGKGAIFEILLPKSDRKSN